MPSILRHLSRIVLLASAIVLAAGPAKADKPVPSTALHLSVTEALRNSERGRLVITVRVQTADLESALSERAQKKVSAADMPEMAPLALDYVREHLSFKTARGQTLKLEWAGSDSTDTQLFLFFEAPLTEGLLGAQITNSLFLEKLPDQINSVVIQDGVLKRTLVFSREHTALTVDSAL